MRRRLNEVSVSDRSVIVIVQERRPGIFNVASCMSDTHVERGAVKRPPPPPAVRPSFPLPAPAPSIPPGDCTTPEWQGTRSDA